MPDNWKKYYAELDKHYLNLERIYREQQEKIERLEVDLWEQYRINGMGQERELRLRAEVAVLKKELAYAWTEYKLLREI
jgi:hypothetical protein